MSRETGVDCKVGGCDREAHYPGLQLCQKHYFRQMRNGTFDLVRKRSNLRRTNLKGYVSLYEPEHPLVMSDGYVYEHRKVIYEKYGDNLPDCEICGAATNWLTCHVDHRDEVVDNNSPDNLRPVCRGCNTSRTPRSTTPVYKCKGKALTVSQWAKQPGVTVTEHQIRIRLKNGRPVEDAIFAPNKTHPRRYAAKTRETLGVTA